MPLAAGARLGVYEVTAQIGEGGMGQVWRARDTKLNRDVALKVLPDSFANDPDRLARFTREAQTLAALNHPNIAGIYGIEAHAFVMELVEGEDLSQRIARGAIPIDEALPIAKQIADALEAAHEQGIIHRDLKPANIKVRESGTVKVLDFGLAKAMDPAGASSADVINSPTLTARATQMGVLLGTAAYMSPEQARGKVVDKRADIWAFGCVVYETLTGRRAFEGETLTDVLAAVVKNDPEWAALPPDTPRAVRTLLRRCLQKDPAKRLHDIADARIEIQDAISEPEPSVDLAPEPRRARLVSAVPWVLAVALAIVAAWLGVRTGSGAAVSPPTTRLELNLPPGVESYVSPNSLAFSPDGTRLAFMGSVQGYRRVYLRTIQGTGLPGRSDTFEAEPVRGTDQGTSVSFSPSGRSIVVILSNRTLETVSLEDGLVNPLVNDADANSGAAWGPDDRITFGRDNVLWQIPAFGGPQVQLTKLNPDKGEGYHAFPAVVAGGKAILFAVLTGSGRDSAHIEALSLADDTRHPLDLVGTSPQYAPSGHLIFFRGRALLAAPFDEDRLQVTGPVKQMIDELRVSTIGTPMAAVSRSGSLAYMSGMAVSQLVSVSRLGVESPITRSDRSYAFPRVEPPVGQRVLVSADGDLWINDMLGKTLTRLSTETTTGNSYPVWVPDGQHVVFRTLMGLDQMDINGGHPQPIPGTSLQDYPTSISLNGDTLIFVRTVAGSGGDVYALSLGGEPKPHPLVSTPAYEGGGQLSPDGRWLAYTSDDSGSDRAKVTQILVQPFPGLDRKYPVAQRGKFPRWTSQGRELVYLDGDKMMAVDVSTSAGEPQFKPPRVLFEQRYLYGTSTSVPNYDVSPDGQRFVMVKAESGSNRFNVVLNWTEELKRLVPR